MPLKLRVLSADHLVSGPWTEMNFGAEVPESYLTPTPGGNNLMGVYNGTLYIQLSGPAACFTACELDRAAALGHVLDGEASPWPFRPEVAVAAGQRSDVPSTDQLGRMADDLQLLLPDYSWDVQAGSSATPVVVSASNCLGTVQLNVTRGSYQRHRSMATLVCDIVRAVRKHTEVSLPSHCTL